MEHQYDILPKLCQDLQSVMITNTRRKYVNQFLNYE